MLEVITGVGEMARRAARLAREGEGVALVPTMGWLHEGHLSLIRDAARRRPVAVVSIFVNPAQFGPGEDFERYPRDLDRDCRSAGEAGARIVFAPPAAEMYPPGFQTWVEPGKLAGFLCGASRPGHFRGVATVVLKLFGIVRPEVAIFGMKDYQQLLIVRKMAEDLNLGVEIVGHPIVREPDGLAMSSRNSYLSAEERRRALCLRRALLAGEKAVGAGVRDAARLRMIMRGEIEAEPGAVIDYVSVADPATLEDLELVNGPALLAVAAKIGPARLIDNLITGK